MQERRGVRAWWLAMVVAWVGVVPSSAWAGDRLDAARNEAGASAPSSSSSDDDDAGEGILGLLGLFAAGDDDDDTSIDATAATLHVDSKRGFLPYPYAGGREGYMVRAAPDEDVASDTRAAAFRIGTEGAFLYEDVWRASANLRMMMPRFYIQGRYDLMLEGPTPVVDGDVEVHGKVRDRLHFASFELGPQLSPGERLAVRFGLAGTVMFDDPQSLPQEPTVTPGIGGALEVDLYPVRPLVFSGRGAVMGLGKTVMLEARATVGVSLNRFEIFAGYDHRQIGAVHLGGPTAGVAVRF